MYVYIYIYKSERYNETRNGEGSRDKCAVVIDGSPHLLSQSYLRISLSSGWRFISDDTWIDSILNESGLE